MAPLPSAGLHRSGTDRLRNSTQRRDTDRAECDGQSRLSIFHSWQCRRARAASAARFRAGRSRWLPGRRLAASHRNRRLGQAYESHDLFDWSKDLADDRTPLNFLKREPMSRRWRSDSSGSVVTRRSSRTELRARPSSQHRSSKHAQPPTGFIRQWPTNRSAALGRTFRRSGGRRQRQCGRH